MAEDWFRICADIINMDITGPPSHVKVLPNAPDLNIFENAFGEWYADTPDPDDESTNTNRGFVVEVHFDAQTDLEASLATSAVAGFVRRRLSSLDNVVVIGRANNPEGAMQ